MIKIPKEFKTYFWDIDFSKLDASKSPQFIIKRVLDRGNVKSIEWLFNNYKDREMIDTILSIRDFSQVSANFWAKVFKLDKSRIPVLQRPPEEYPWGMIS